jgi:hypothetical protein
VPEVYKIAFAPKEEAQGRPGARCTRGLVCKLHKRKRTRAYRFSGAVRPSLRNGFTAYFVLSPVTGFLATVAPEKRELLKDLTPASGRQDHTTSPYATFAVRPAQKRVRHHCVHRIPSQRQ